MACPYGRQFRQTEIQNLRLAARGHENIGRLDIAMDDALRVGGIQGVGNLDGEVKQGIRL